MILPQNVGNCLVDKCIGWILFGRGAVSEDVTKVLILLVMKGQGN